jgi:hypothetical protein
MRNALLIASVVLLFSCKSNQECKDEIFGDYNWHNTASSQGYYDNLRFGDDDTLTFDQSSFSTTNVRYWYKFDDKCEGFYLGQEQPVAYFKITYKSSNHVTVVNNSTTLELYR